MEEKGFPEELITEIIRRVASKPLSRFTCVSKSWCSLIRTDPYFFRHQRTASLRRLHRRIRLDILEGWTVEEWDDRSEVWGSEMAREILSTYHLNVIPELWREHIEYGLYKGYAHLGYVTLIGRKETGLSPTRFRCAFTLEDLQSDRLQCLARLAMDHYNEEMKENWVFEEAIYLDCPFRYQSLTHFLMFGARNTRNVLCLFAAKMYSSRDKSQAVISVNTIEETVKIFDRRSRAKVSFRDKIIPKWPRGGDQMDDQGKQLDSYIVRQTRKRTYVKQADSSINSYRTTEGDKIWSSIEKDRRIDEDSMLMT